MNSGAVYFHHRTQMMWYETNTYVFSAGIQCTEIGSCLLRILSPLDHNWNERSAGPTTTLTSKDVRQKAGFELYQWRFFSFLSTLSVAISRLQTVCHPSWDKLRGSLSGNSVDITISTLWIPASKPTSVLRWNSFVTPVGGIGRP